MVSQNVEHLKNHFGTIQFNNKMNESIILILGSDCCGCDHI